MSFRLYADLGNTALHVGLWRQMWIHERRIARRELRSSGEPGEATDETDLAERYEVALEHVMNSAGVRRSQCEGALVCASTPAVAPLERAIECALGVKPRLIGRDQRIALEVAYDNPDSFGQDRLVAAYGAQQLVGQPCIVLSVGTCITCDALAGGKVWPVAIAPGLPALQQGLVRATPHLAGALHEALVGELWQVAAPARSTIECLALGLVGALTGSLERLLAAARTVPGVGRTAPVVMTGGDAPLLLHLAPGPARLEPLLVLDGMRQLDEEEA